MKSENGFIFYGGLSTEIETTKAILKITQETNERNKSFSFAV